MATAGLRLLAGVRPSLRNARWNRARDARVAVSRGEGTAGGPSTALGGRHANVDRHENLQELQRPVLAGNVGILAEPVQQRHAILDDRRRRRVGTISVAAGGELRSRG